MAASRRRRAWHFIDIAYSWWLSDQPHGVEGFEKVTKATGNRLFYSGGHRLTDRGWRRIRKHLQESLLEGDDRHFVV